MKLAETSSFSVLASSYVTAVATLPAAPPVIVAVVTVWSQVMLNPAGMWTRMSFLALMVGAAASVMVMGLMVVAVWPTTNVWLAPDTTVCAAPADAQPLSARTRPIARAALIGPSTSQPR